MTVSAGRFAEVPERSVIEVSMIDFELWLKIFPSPVGLKNRQALKSVPKEKMANTTAKMCPETTPAPEDHELRSIIRRQKRTLNMNCSDSGSSKWMERRKEWSQVSALDVQRFLDLILNDPVIDSFHIHDVCMKSSDRYLIAMVFVYFKKAKLLPNEFTRHNFFLALYLAHEIEEEREEDRWELLPWALGKGWRRKYCDFVKEKNEFWRRLDFKAMVSFKACQQVLSLKSFKNHPAFSRFRSEKHCKIERIPMSLEKPKFIPHGPLWHSEGGKAWLLNNTRNMALSDPTIQSCTMCHDENLHAVTSIAKALLMSADIKAKFLKASKILDAEWMDTEDPSEQSRNLSIISTGLDLNMSQMEDDDPFNFNSSSSSISPSQSKQFHQTQFRKVVDQLWITLSPPSSEGDTDLFTIKDLPNSGTRKRPAAVKAESEVENNSQYIDVNQMKRTKLASNVKNVDTLCSLIFSDED